MTSWRKSSNLRWIMPQCHVQKNQLDVRKNKYVWPPKNRRLRYIVEVPLICGVNVWTASFYYFNNHVDIYIHKHNDQYTSDIIRFTRFSTTVEDLLIYLYIQHNFCVLSMPNLFRDYNMLEPIRICYII